MSLGLVRSCKGRKSAFSQSIIAEDIFVWNRFCTINQYKIWNISWEHSKCMFSFLSLFCCRLMSVMSVRPLLAVQFCCYDCVSTLSHFVMQLIYYLDSTHSVYLNGCIYGQPQSNIGPQTLHAWLVCVACNCPEVCNSACNPCADVDVNLHYTHRTTLVSYKSGPSSTAYVCPASYMVMRDGLVEREGEVPMDNVIIGGQLRLSFIVRPYESEVRI